MTPRPRLFRELLRPIAHLGLTITGDPEDDDGEEEDKKRKREEDENEEDEEDEEDDDGEDDEEPWQVNSYPMRSC